MHEDILHANCHFLYRMIIKTKQAIEDNKDDVPEALQKKLMALYVPPPPPPPKPKPKATPVHSYDSDSSESGGVDYGGNGTIYDRTGNRILRIDTGSDGDIYNRKGDCNAIIALRGSEGPRFMVAGPVGLVQLQGKNPTN